MFSTESPCTGICTLNAEDVCVGCGRRLDEISMWSRAPEAYRQLVVERAAARLAEIRAGKSAPPASP